MRKCLLDESERLEFLSAFLSCCLWCKIYFGWRPNLKDEGDNHLIELAVAGGAKYIIMALTEFDAENRFKVLASRGDKQRGLELLNKLQSHYGDTASS